MRNCCESIIRLKFSCTYGLRHVNSQARFDPLKQKLPPLFSLDRLCVRRLIKYLLHNYDISSLYSYMGKHTYMYVV